MRKFFALLLFLPLGFMGCKETLVHPNPPNAILNISINLQEPQYYDLRFVSGFMYLKSEENSTSRGLIAYRFSETEFRVYDRLPPNEPDACCDSEGNCTRLMVEIPFVVDNCNGIKYNILNGDLFEGEGIYPLFQYHTSFDGITLRIFN